MNVANHISQNNQLYLQHEFSGFIIEKVYSDSSKKINCEKIV